MGAKDAVTEAKEKILNVLNTKVELQHFDFQIAFVDLKMTAIISLYSVR